MNPLRAMLLVTSLGGAAFACDPGASVPSVTERAASAPVSDPASLPSAATAGGLPETPTASASAALTVAPSGSASLDVGVAKRRYSVAAIGDSLSDPKAHGGGYLTYLAAHCKESRFDTYGKGGNMVSQMKQRFARDVLGEGGEARPEYTHMLVLGGIADIGSNQTAARSLDKIQNDLLAMYRMAHERGMTVVAFTIPPWGAWHTYDDEMHRMMLAMNTWLRTKAETV